MYNLESPHPVMSTTGQYGFDFFLFESCGKFYIWGLNENGVDLIEHPTTLEDIIKAMKKDEMRGLDLKALEPCGEW